MRIKRIPTPLSVALVIGLVAGSFLSGTKPAAATGPCSVDPGTVQVTVGAQDGQSAITATLSCPFENFQRSVEATIGGAEPVTKKYAAGLVVNEPFTFSNLKDGLYTITFSVRNDAQFSSYAFVQVRELRVEQDHKGYVVKLVSKDDTKRTASFSLTVPAGNAGRTASVFYDARTPGTPVAINAGQLPFGFLDVPPGDHTATARIKDGNRTFDVAMPGGFQMSPGQQGGCKVEPVVDTAHRTAQVKYTMQTFDIGTSNGYTLKRTMNGITKEIPVDPEKTLTIFVNFTGLLMGSNPAKLVLEHSYDFTDQLGTTVSHKDIVCDNAFDLTVGKIEPPTPRTPTDPTARVPFTWLSGKCIRLAEDEQLTAVVCVAGDTISLLLELSGICCTGLVIFGGIRLEVAVEDAQREAAQNTIWGALKGLIVILLAYIIVQILFSGGIF